MLSKLHDSHERLTLRLSEVSSVTHFVRDGAGTPSDPGPSVSKSLLSTLSVASVPETRSCLLDIISTNWSPFPHQPAERLLFLPRSPPLEGLLTLPLLPLSGSEMIPSHQVPTLLVHAPSSLHLGFLLTRSCLPLLCFPIASHGSWCRHVATKCWLQAT